MASLVTWNSRDMIHDIEHLRKGFGELPPALAKRFIRSAIKRAMEPYMPMFRSAAPRRTGKLRRSVTTVVDFAGTSGYFTGRVGYGRGRGRMGHHAILVADGTAPRYTRANKRAYRGVMPANTTVAGLADRIRAMAPPMFETHLTAALDNAIKTLPIYTARSIARRRG